MPDIEILSINVAMPRCVRVRDREVRTGIFKIPVQQPVYLSKLNFDGDGQGDPVHHGGPEKAVCVYPHEHYSHWERVLNRTLVFGAFGENVTTRGLVETDVCIGDVFQFGEAVIQVSQPRQPCYKLAVRYGLPEMPLKVQETGYTGFYCRVLKEGMVSPADGLTRIVRHPAAVTIAYANHIMHRDKNNVEGVKKILEVEELSANWRRTFLKRLEGHEVDPRERLTGIAPGPKQEDPTRLREGNDVPDEDARPSAARTGFGNSGSRWRR